MFDIQLSGETFRREVATEVAYLTNLHGDEALKVAREKASRPNLRTSRRRVLEATVRCLEKGLKAPPLTLWGRLFG